MTAAAQVTAPRNPVTPSTPAPKASPFETALAALTQAVNAVALHKEAADNAGLNEAVKKAARSAAWAAFDEVTATLNAGDQVIDGETVPALTLATQRGETLAAEIADARGIDPEKAQYRVYRQRGRALATYAGEIAQQGVVYTVTKGKNKGEERNGREERDPLTVAKNLLEAKQEREERAKAHADKSATYGAEALRRVSERLSEETGDTITPEDLAMMVATGMDDQAQAVRGMIASTIDELASRQSLFSDLRAVLARFADASPEERAKAFELCEVLAA